MRQKLVISFVTVILMISFGCKKSSDSSTTPAPTDLATTAAGQYPGNWLVSGVSVPGTCDVVKATSTTVNLNMSIQGSALPALPGIILTDGGSGKINLSFSDASGTITGSIVSKTLNLTIVSGSTTMTYTGVKP